MAEYTPTTAEVRDRYTAARYYLDDAPEDGENYRSGGAEFDRWLAGVIRDAEAKALREARVHIEWDEGVPHDDEWEYTCSSDCDGTNVMYQRRHPRYHGEWHPWEPATREAFDAARARADRIAGEA